MATASSNIARLNSQVFIDRCHWAVIFLIRWIADEPLETPYHNERREWRAAAMANPAAMARTMANFAITDSACSGDDEPDDDAVKSAIESLVNSTKWMLAI